MRANHLRSCISIPGRYLPIISPINDRRSLQKISSPSSSPFYRQVVIYSSCVLPQLFMFSQLQSLFRKILTWGNHTPPIPPSATTPPATEDRLTIRYRVTETVTITSVRDVEVDIPSPSISFLWTVATRLWTRMSRVRPSSSS